MLSSVGKLYTLGVKINWQQFDAPFQPNRQYLPTYPFQRQRYWYESKNKSTKSTTVEALHPLIDKEVAIGATLVNWQTLCYQKMFTVKKNSLLQSHQILARNIFPLAGYLEMVLAAQKQSGSIINYTLHDIIVSKPLAVSNDAEVLVQILLEPENQGTHFRIVSNDKKDRKWTQHFSGVLTPVIQQKVREKVDIDNLKRQHSSTLSVQKLYDAFSCLGMVYGNYLQPLKEINTAEHSVLGLLELPEVCSDAEDYILHPSLVDGALQTIASLGFAGDSIEKSPYLPYCIEKIKIFEELPKSLWCWTSLSKQNQESSDILVADIVLFSNDGKIFATLNQVCAKRVTNTDSFGKAKSTQINQTNKDWFYQIEWVNQAKGELRSIPQGTWIVFADDLNIGNTLSQKFTSLGHKYIQVKPGKEFQALSKQKYIINPESSEDYNRLLTSISSEFEDI